MMDKYRYLDTFKMNCTADLRLDVGDAVQGEVVAGVEVLGEGEDGKVRRGPHVFLLLTPLDWAAGADDGVLELGPVTGVTHL